jgi:hypothetical protein
MEQTPVRRHVEIKARSAAQLELRLHWLARALSVRRGYIVCMLRRLDGAGRHLATVDYELPLPSFVRPGRPHRDRRHTEPLYGARESNDARQGQDSSSSLM